MFEALFLWLAENVQNFGYLGIFVLMLIESTFLPLPSEFVLIPAGYLIFIGQMSWIPALICATAGSVIGAYLNYMIAFKLGRPIVFRLIDKFGKYVFVSRKHMEKTEIYFQEHGAIATFIGRLILIVRHLISLSAGFARMPIKSFMIYTAIGAFIWSLILLIVGYVVGQNFTQISKYSNQITIWTIIGSVIIISIYYLWNKNKKPIKKRK